MVLLKSQSGRQSKKHEQRARFLFQVDTGGFDDDDGWVGEGDLGGDRSLRMDGED
jgi:hypothetical protein